MAVATRSMVWFPGGNWWSFCKKKNQLGVFFCVCWILRGFTCTSIESMGHRKLIWLMTLHDYSVRMIWTVPGFQVVARPHPVTAVIGSSFAALYCSIFSLQVFTLLLHKELIKLLHARSFPLLPRITTHAFLLHFWVCQSQSVLAFDDQIKGWMIICHQWTQHKDGQVFFGSTIHCMVCLNNTLNRKLTGRT